MTLEQLKAKWQNKAERNIRVLESDNTDSEMRSRAVDDLNLINEINQDLDKL